MITNNNSWSLGAVAAQSATVIPNKNLDQVEFSIPIHLPGDLTAKHRPKNRIHVARLLRGLSHPFSPWVPLVAFVPLVLWVFPLPARIGIPRVLRIPRFASLVAVSLSKSLCRAISSVAFPS